MTDPRKRLFHEAEADPTVVASRRVVQIKSQLEALEEEVERGQDTAHGQANGEGAESEESEINEMRKCFDDEEGDEDNEHT